MVDYAPGKVEAIAWKKGRRLTAAVETTGQPYTIVIHSSKPTLLADGRDAVVVNVSVADRQGREVPDADKLLHFAVTGPAKIIGVGNGNPSSHEPDQYADGGWQRQLFNGRCQVILQSTVPGHSSVAPEGMSATGPVSLTVTGDGLPEGVLTIRP
jgi:beta-galactosidase